MAFDSKPPHWQRLTASAERIAQTSTLELLDDKARNAALRLSLAGCHFDFSRQRVDRQILDELLYAAQSASVVERRDAMLSGARLNRSEDRAVLHAALRDGAPNAPRAIKEQVEQTKARLFELANALRSGQRRGYSGKVIRDIVHIGIGGSHLGPELAVTALTCNMSDSVAPNIHFVANVDAQDITKTLQDLNPETTVFIVVSKSFGTLETQLNANTARSWFLERTADVAAVQSHFIGVTANITAAAKFGLHESNIYPMWDWVGGRFSLWSAVGLPILLKLGRQGFEQFLAGAKAADEHFASAPAGQNIPMLAALIGVWNTASLGCDSLAVLCYDQRLALLPSYLQQLEMESNGKSVSLDGDPLDYRTMQILWGGCGTNGQHAYHQLLHQGTSRFAADIVLVAQDDLEHREHRQWLVANGLAQGQAMALGAQSQALSEAHKAAPGNHPSTTIVLDRLEPRQLGCLLAIYEHKVFCQGVLWNINSFDQWGVELGKQLAAPIFTQLGKSDASAQDSATRHLIDLCRSADTPPS